MTLTYYKILVFRLLAALGLVLGKDFLALLITPLSASLSYIPVKFLFGATKVGNTFTLWHHSIDYAPVCAAVGAYIFLGLLILFSKDIPWNTGWKIFLLGSMLILIANIIRVDILLYILGKGGADLFVTLHLFFWKILSGVYVAVVWVFLSQRYKIGAIPIYSDLRYLYKKSVFKK